MKVSVIIPTHNRGHLISRSIDSVLRQTYQNIEVVIVDDGSTDDTESRLGPYIEAGRINYEKKANSGAGDSRNYGIVRSSGELVTFLDSDDEVEPTWIARLVDAFSKVENCQVVFCGCSTFDENGNLLYVKFPAVKGPLFYGLNCRFTNSGMFMLRRRFFDEIGGYDSLLPSSQHTELGIRAAKVIVSKAYSTAVVMESLVRINIHSGPRIRTDSSAKSVGVRMLFRKHRERILLDSEAREDYLRILTLDAYKRRDFFDLLKFGAMYVYYYYIVR